MLLRGIIEMGKLLRRTLLIAACGLVSACQRQLRAATQSATLAKELTDEDRALAHKYRGIRGGELRVDALVNVPSTALHMPDGRLFNIGTGSFRPGRVGISGYGGSVQGDRLVVPKYLRMTRYAEGSKRTGTRLAPPVYDGELVHEAIVPIAARIPDAVLDRVRKYNGSLALKLRLTLDTILVGWEVRNGRSYPFKLDKDGYAYSTDEDNLPGAIFVRRRNSTVRWCEKAGTSTRKLARRSRPTFDARVHYRA
jgi:hypothetical protein